MNSRNPIADPPENGHDPSDEEFMSRTERARRFAKRLFRNRLVLVSVIILVAFIFIALFASQIVPENPYRSVIERRLAEPSAELWLGADLQGRDMVSRLIMGSQIALYVGFLAVSVGLILGGLIGLFSGYYGGLVDTVLMRLMDIILSFPYLLLVIFVVSLIGPGVTNAMLAISVTYIPQYARLVRSVVVSVKEQDFVDGAHAIGASAFRTMFIHIAPHTVAHLIILSTINLGKAILAEAGLSFLGLGVQPPQPSWGGMIAAGRDYLINAPHLSISPGLAVIVVVVSLNIFGDGLRDALDPKQI